MMHSHEHVRGSKTVTEIRGRERNAFRTDPSLQQNKQTSYQEMSFQSTTYAVRSSSCSGICSGISPFLNYKVSGDLVSEQLFLCQNSCSIQRCSLNRVVFTTAPRDASSARSAGTASQFVFKVVSQTSTLRVYSVFTHVTTTSHVGGPCTALFCFFLMPLFFSK